MYDAYVDIDLSPLLTSSNVTIKDHWARTYSCGLRPNWQIANTSEANGFCKTANAGLPGYGIPPASTNHVYVNGRFFHIIKNFDGDPMDLWYPFNPHKNTSRPIWYAISVKTYEPNANGMDESNGILSESVTIYPNPVSDVLKVKLDSKIKSSINTEILDISGKVVAKQESIAVDIGENELELDVQHLNNGLYFVNISSGNSSITKKININKH